MTNFKIAIGVSATILIIIGLVLLFTNISFKHYMTRFTNADKYKKIEDLLNKTGDDKKKINQELLIALADSSIIEADLESDTMRIKYMTYLYDNKNDLFVKLYKKFGTPSDDQKAADEKAAAEKKAAEEKKAADDQKAIDDQKAADEAKYNAPIDDNLDAFFDSSLDDNAISRNRLDTYYNYGILDGTPYSTTTFQLPYAVDTTNGRDMLIDKLNFNCNDQCFNDESCMGNYYQIGSDNKTVTCGFFNVTVLDSDPYKYSLLYKGIWTYTDSLNIGSTVKGGQKISGMQQLNDDLVVGFGLKVIDNVIDQYNNLLGQITTTIDYITKKIGYNNANHTFTNAIWTSSSLKTKYDTLKTAYDSITPNYDNAKKYTANEFAAKIIVLDKAKTDTTTKLEELLNIYTNYNTYIYRNLLTITTATNNF